MDESPAPVTDRRAAAAEKLAERRRRVRAIRRRVAGLSLTAFMATSATVLVQMVTGHDPALAHSTRATASATTSTQRSSSHHTASSSSSAAAPSAVRTRAS
jgi:D-aminopeptidase